MESAGRHSVRSGTETGRQLDDRADGYARPWKQVEAPKEREALERADGKVVCSFTCSILAALLTVAVAVKLVHGPNSGIRLSSHDVPNFQVQAVRLSIRTGCAREFCVRDDIAYRFWRVVGKDILAREGVDNISSVDTSSNGAARKIGAV